MRGRAPCRAGEHMVLPKPLVRPFGTCMSTLMVFPYSGNLANGGQCKFAIFKKSKLLFFSVESFRIKYCKCVSMCYDAYAGGTVRGNF